MESGVTLSSQDGQFATTVPTLLRVGLSPDWEFRLESDLLVLQNPGLNSFSDISLGAKGNFLRTEDTSVGLLFKLNVPIGHESLRGSIDPSVTVLWDQSLVGDLAMSLNAGLNLTEDQFDSRFLQYFWSASVSHPLSDKVTLYGELYGEGPDGSGEPTRTAADAGLLFLLNNDLQLDVSYARGLSSDGLDWSVGLGLSSRF